MEPESISIFFKKIKEKAEILSIKFEQSFNRNLFFLTLKDDEIKTEFTYFPFLRIEKTKKIGDLEIDSLIDIAVNKVFTIYQKPRSRDFIDLYLILKQTASLNMDYLVKQAQVKFDHSIDPINLSAQFVKAKILKDYPKMIIEISPDEWQGFFTSEAKRLSESQLEG